MRINAWNKGPIWDLAAMSDIECPNLFLFKDPNWKENGFLMYWDITVGPYNFTPGKVFTSIGSRGKTSAGFTWYHAKPGGELQYYGFYRHLNGSKFNNYLLFTKKDKDPEPLLEEYHAAFYTWCILNTGKPALFTLNYSGSPRVTECAVPSYQLSLFNQ